MKRALLLLLFLLSCLVEVQSQTEYPYITFRGNVLPNHSYVDLSQVGNDRSGSDSDTVQCHTDLSTCCRSNHGPHRGDWFAPGSDTSLTFYSDGDDIYKDRQDQVVHLRRRNNAGGPSGIYRCVIATNSVHDDSDQSVGEIVYVGLYASRQGDITISGGMTFTVDSGLNGASPQFTLTCISTGGPATTVTWIRDSVNVTEGIMTVLGNRTTSQYTHTLTVTGRLAGLYTCTVANNKPSEGSAQLDVQVANTPTNVMAVREGPTSIRVSWSPPTPLGDTTGYRIYYSGDSSGSEDVSHGSTDNYLLTGLQNGGIYTISIVAMSRHFPSGRVTVMDIGLGLSIACSVSGVSDVKIECGGITPQTPLTCSFNQGPLHPCTLPLLLNSDVSPLGNHSVRIVANRSEATVPYSINEVSAQVPPLGVYLINESPEIINDTVRVEFLTTRPVFGVRCFLKHALSILQEYSCSPGQALLLPILRDRLYELKIYAYNSKRDEVTVKRGFVVTSDPNYCSLMLVNRGVVVSEDGTSAVVEVAVYGPATRLTCVLDGKTPFTCTSPVQLSGLTEGKHKLKISPVGCSGGSKKLKVHFTT